jgi:sugar lactone lactonase YvrE
MSHMRVTAVQPYRAIEGGRINLLGSDLLGPDAPLPEVHIDHQLARIVHASSRRISVLVPPGTAEGGPLPIRVGGVAIETAFVHVAAPFATGLHQVDSPVFDRQGNLYLTYSGTRGQQVPVSIFRVRPDGTRETFASGIVNATSMAVDEHGSLYVSSRFESTVYVLGDDGTSRPFATDLGVACGLAFASDGTLYVGDRSGTIFKLDRAGKARVFASVPASVAAFHLTFGLDDVLYVTAPTLSTYDPVYRVARDGTVTPLPHRFGRPQGLAVDPHGTLFVVEALAGASGLYRVSDTEAPELVLAGPDLVGVAFAPDGRLVVCSNETAYRLSLH